MLRLMPCWRDVQDILANPARPCLHPVPAGSLCQSDASGACSSQPVTPPVVVDGCTVDVCFLLDDSGSVVKVDAWNDITAAARSIMQVGRWAGCVFSQSLVNRMTRIRGEIYTINR